MASVREEILINASPSMVWEALRDFGAVHRRLVPGFVVDLRMEGEERIVTFFNGAVVRERLVAVDEQARRLVYTAVEGPMGTTHHNASAQVVADGDAGTRFIWITDLLPDDLAEPIGKLMQQGARVIKQTLETRASSLRAAEPNPGLPAGHVQ
jgi:carbon monoxide dehydrogenase subunit G